MANQTVHVGPYPIEVSEGHIYLAPDLPPTYDYVPWNIIAAVTEEVGLRGICLIDVGANVGDSLAHFRRFSNAPVICIEPSPEFFAILEKNSQQFRDVTLINKLLVPDDLRGRVSFQSGSQTGFSAEVLAAEQAWHGEYVTFGELHVSGNGPFVVKTDTDGFDAKIVKSLLESLHGRFESVPIVFFEGCSAPQLRSGDVAEWLEIMARLQDHGYELLILTNHGTPYVYAGTDVEVARSAVIALQTGYMIDMAICHYYDVIAVHRSIRSALIRLQSPWPASVFARG